MKFKKALVWSCMTGEPHPSLNKKEQTIEGVMPLVEALFPGVNYYSITGFGQVMRECVIPALKKRFPELLTTPAEKIKPTAMTEVAAVLPSKGYEWQGSTKWRSKFEKFLAAA